jgi:hypothetical protein
MTILTNAEPVTTRKLKGRAQTRDSQYQDHITRVGVDLGGVGADHLTTEIVALHLSLTDVLSPVPYRERMSVEQYQELMRNVKTTKQRAAREVIAQYVAKNEEEHHA